MESLCWLLKKKSLTEGDLLAVCPTLSGVGGWRKVVLNSHIFPSVHPNYDSSKSTKIGEKVLGVSSNIYKNVKMSTFSLF